MKKINTDTLSQPLQTLIKELETLTEKTVIVQTDTETTTDYLDLSQSEHSETGEEITISISNAPDVNYMIAHELFHIKLDYSDFTKMSVQLFSNDAQLNQQSQLTASSLKGIVDHRLIEFWETEAGLRTPEVQSLLNKGTLELLTAADVDATDSELVLYRTLVMLDNYNEITASNDYEQPLIIAKKLNDAIRQVTNMEQHYSALVRLFSEFDDNIKILGYIDLLHTLLITLTPIFSSRQLRLTVNQVLELVHSDLVTQDNVHPFILEMKSSHQNSGLIKLANDKQTPEFFKELYQQTLSEFLAEYQIDYLIR